MEKRNLKERILHALVYGIGGAAGSRVLMALANVVLSRILGQEVYGKFSSLNSTVNLFVLFSGMGLSATLTRYAAMYRQKSDRLGIYIGTLRRICELMSLAFAIVMLFAAKQISFISTGGYELTEYFKVVAVVVYFASVSAVEQSIMIGLEKFRQSSMVQLVRCTVFLIMGYVLSLQWGIWGSVYALLISHLFQYVMSHVINAREYRSRKVKLRFVWGSETREAIIIFAIPAFLSSMFVMPVNWVCNAIVTSRYGFSELAIFNVASQWMTYITYIPSQMGQMRPIYTDLYQKEDICGLQKLVKKVTFTTTALAAVVAVVVGLFSNLILSAYGDGYVENKLPFYCMLATAVFFTAQVQTGFTIQAIGKMWIATIINAIWGFLLIATLLINIQCLPGALSYSVGYLLSYMITCVMQLLIAKKLLFTNVPKNE